MALSRKILANRRREHSVVVAHKRRIRDEVKPKLHQVKRDWYYGANKNNQMIREKWNSQKGIVSGIQREQRLKHRAKILDHKRKIREEMARRR